MPSRVFSVQSWNVDKTRLSVDLRCDTARKLADLTGHRHTQLHDLLSQLHLQFNKQVLHIEFLFRTYHTAIPVSRLQSSHMKMPFTLLRL